MTNDTPVSDTDDQSHGIGERDGFLTIYFKGGSVFGEMYWPIYSIDLRPTMEKQRTNQFMIRFNGQISELISEPLAPSTIRPQEVLPVQSTSRLEEGSPELCSLSQYENVTVCFTMGQSKS